MEQQPLATGTNAGPTRQFRLDPKRTIKLPSLISDQVSMSAFFTAPVREAKKLLPSKKLRLVELYPGTTLVGITAMEYKQVEGLESYREVGIMVPVRYAPRFDIPVLPIVAPQLFQNAGYYFHRMPLTSPDAYELGLKVHGLRKLLADIRFEEEPFVRRCIVQAEGKHLLTLEVRKVKTRFQRMTTHTYTMLDGRILRTPVPTRGQMGMGRGARAGKLVLGDHYIANEIRALGLGAQPMLTMYGPATESVLAAPDQTLPA